MPERPIPSVCPYCNSDVSSTVCLDSDLMTCSSCGNTFKSSAAQNTIIGQADPASIRQIGGYWILGEIARGGMGVVYRAEHAKLKKRVALKVLIAGEHASEVGIKRLVREAQLAAKLSHPGIIPVHDLGQEGSLFYFVMEHVEGDPLDKVIKQGPMDFRRAAEIVKQAADAVQYAHERSIIHRDLKPSNIMVRPGGQVVVFDFGLARDLSPDPDGTNLTESGSIMGTLAYMAPEQARADLERVGPCSDIYSLGAVLYECLCGRGPFSAPNQLALLRKVVEDPPVPPRHHNPEASPCLEAIALRCLEKDPGRRYGSAKELSISLQEFLEGKGAQQVGGPILHRAQAKRVLWGLVGTLTVMAALILIVIGMSLHSPSKGSSSRNIPPGNGKIERNEATDSPESGSQQAPSTDSSRELGIELGDKEKMVFVFVPAGEFTRGSDDSYDDERPARRIRQPNSYYIGKYPVTVGQFRRFVTETQYITDAERLKSGFALTDGVWKASHGATWKSPGFSQDSNHPVVLVSWNDASAFALWVTDVCRRKVRLPTEAEWEYAARGQDSRIYPWGNRWDGAKVNHVDLSFHKTNAAPEWNCSGDDDGIAFTAVVGHYPNASWCGAFDMVGNVCQWCQDWYDKEYYSTSATTDPKGPSTGTYRVIRGGGWNTAPVTCRSAWRAGSNAWPTTGLSNVGFRLVVSETQL